MSEKESDVVIVGAGQAGLQAASSLRDEGYRGRIRLLGDEAYAPYQRPPLSKSFLGGELGIEELTLELPSFFEQAGIEFLSGERVVEIDRAERRLALASGLTVAYEHLILATGSRNRSLPCLGDPMDGVLSLRSIEDAKALKHRMAVAKRIVVIGAGFLGLESATIAAGLGAKVHVVEATDRVMERAVSPAMSKFFRDRHAANGVQFSFDGLVVAIHGTDDGCSEVELSDGMRLPADLVLVAIGVVPNIELAEAAGLEACNGIVVDERLHTSDDAITAIGDCAAFPYVFDHGASIRLESVQNAVDQGRYVAQRLVVGVDEPYNQVPLFWSEQAGLRLQMAGIAQSDDSSVVRGDPETGQFSVFRYHRQRLVCVESVNRPADHMAGRKLLLRKLSPTPEQASDPSFDLRQFVTAAEEGVRGNR